MDVIGYAPGPYGDGGSQILNFGVAVQLAAGQLASAPADGDHLRGRSGGGGGGGVKDSGAVDGDMVPQAADGVVDGGVGSGMEPHVRGRDDVGAFLWMSAAEIEAERRLDRSAAQRSACIQGEGGKRQVAGGAREVRREEGAHHPGSEPCCQALPRSVGDTSNAFVLLAHDGVPGSPSRASCNSSRWRSSIKRNPTRIRPSDPPVG